MEQLVVVTAYVTKAVKIDQLEAVVEDFHDFLLREASKAEDEVLNLLRDLTYYIILIRHLPRNLRWGRCRGGSCRSGSSGNASVGLFPYTFEPKCMLGGSSSPLVLGLLAVDLENLQVLLLSQAWMKSLGRIDRGGWGVAWAHGGRGRKEEKKEKAESKETLARWRLWKMTACKSNESMHKG